MNPYKSPDSAAVRPIGAVATAARFKYFNKKVGLCADFLHAAMSFINNASIRDAAPDFCDAFRVIHITTHVIDHKYGNRKFISPYTEPVAE